MTVAGTAQAGGSSACAGPTPERLLLIRRGFIDSQVLQTCAKLRICNILDAEPGLTWQEVGQRAGLVTHDQFHGTQDFLDMLVTLAVLDREGDGRGATYRNSAEAAAFMVEGRPGSINGLLISDHDRTLPNLRALSEALHTGEVSEVSKARLGILDIRDVFASDPGAATAFAHAMLAHKTESFRLFARTFDFSRHSTLVDIGGSLGALAAEACLAHPHLTAQTADLPAIHAAAAEYVAGRGVGDRVQVVDLDMFSQPFPAADVITMSQILHDWGLPKKKQLLRKAYEALRPGGALVAIEQIIDDERRTNGRGLSLSLIMLLEFGTENAFDFTFPDFQGWVAEAGFCGPTERIQLHAGFTAVVAYKSR